MGQGGQPHDIAKLHAEGLIFFQRVPPQPAQTLPERHPTRARRPRALLVACHGHAPHPELLHTGAA